MKKGLSTIMVFWCALIAQGSNPQPMVAVHVSEVTKTLETTPASPPTPNGSANTGFQWWMSAWHYHTIYESLEEALRSDGTPFVEVSDSAISAGQLLNSDGSPRYPIVISLASEAVRDDELASLRSYVAAGGTLLIGSSSLSRQPDGTSRADFGLAAEMGLHMANANLQNWYVNTTFSKAADHRLLSHIPAGNLHWQMPLNSEQIPWGTAMDHGQNGPHYVWSVTPTDAQVLAYGDAGALVAVKSYGSGRIIYHGAMQPLIAHGGMGVGMYAYGIFRNAIEWSFESLKTPIIKLSPWRYSYDAAMVVRHDFENRNDLISAIEPSSQVESLAGVKGDYFFCTGQLRVNMSNTPAVIGSLRRAVQNYGATIGSHNGGLINPGDTAADTESYFYWHWGPDEALDLTPPGYSSGLEYARTSILMSYQDIEGWLAGLGQNRRYWVAPFFNSTRDASYGLLEELGAITAGEQKISIFPHWTMSTQTAGKHYAHVTLPTSEWFVGTNTAQAVEEHTSASVRACVDRYYSWGGLINVYGHKSSTEQIVTDYITYALSRPHVWPANASQIYDWWQARSAVGVVVSYNSANGTAIATAAIAGATDPDTAVEIALPNWKAARGNVIQVLTNGIVAGSDSYRFNQNGVKVKVGTTVSKVDVRYSPDAIRPVATDDTYQMDAGTVLAVPAPGLLGNDTTGSKNLKVIVVNAPAHGTLQLSDDGSFAFTPTPGFLGTDQFTYKIKDGTLESNVGTVLVTVGPAGALYFDDFTRTTDPALAAPWTAQLGPWLTTGGSLRGGSPAYDYGFAYIAANWTDYAVQADVRFEPGVYGGGIGGRLNPVTGAHYAAWLYPESAPGNPAALGVLKFSDWWDFTQLQQVKIPGLGSGSHTLKLILQGNQILVALDGATVINVTDTGVSGAVFLSGGVSADLYSGSTPSRAIFDNFLVSAPSAAADSYNVVEGGTLTVPIPGVLGNDTAGNGNGLTAVLASGPLHGTLTLNANGSFVYTPASGFYGTDSFTYVASDGTVKSSVATVVVQVMALPPVAQNDSYSTMENKTLTLYAPGILQNDSSYTGNALSAIVVSGTTHGALNVGGDGALSYAPVFGFSGTDAFTYKANDGINDSAAATVTITVTPAPPVATNDTYQVAAGSTLTVAAPGLLGNDSADPGVALTAILVTGPAHGTLALKPDGSFTYTPAPGFSGPDTFTYKASDGAQNSNVATITINVTAAGPTLQFTDDFTRSTDPAPLTPWVAQRGAWSITGGALQGSASWLGSGIVYFYTNLFDYSVQAQIQSSGSPIGFGFSGRVNAATGARYSAWIDPENSPGAMASLKLLKYTDWSSSKSIQETSIPAVGSGKHVVKLTFQGNQIAVTWDGTMVISNAVDNNLSGVGAYSAGGIGAELWAGLGTAKLALDNVSVNVLATTPVANDDAYAATQNSPLTIAAPGVLANDTAGKGKTVKAVLVSNPAHGSLKLNADGSFTYVPATGFKGVDSFTYKMNDGALDSNVGTVSITVTPLGSLFFDDFARSSDPGPVSPWLVQRGKWAVKGGALQGTGSLLAYSSIYAGTNWTDYSVQGTIQFDDNSFGGGLGGRMNPSTGAHYGVWVYPEGPFRSSPTLMLAKFTGWWSVTPMQQVSIPKVGKVPHTLKLTFANSRITVFLDGKQVVSATDSNVGRTSPYLNGGICAEMWTALTPAKMTVDNIVVTTP